MDSFVLTLSSDMVEQALDGVRVVVFVLVGLRDLVRCAVLRSVSSVEN